MEHDNSAATCGFFLSLVFSHSVVMMTLSSVLTSLALFFIEIIKINDSQKDCLVVAPFRILFIYFFL